MLLGTGVLALCPRDVSQAAQGVGDIVRDLPLARDGQGFFVERDGTHGVLTVLGQVSQVAQRDAQGRDVAKLARDREALFENRLRRVVLAEVMRHDAEMTERLGDAAPVATLAKDLGCFAQVGASGRVVVLPQREIAERAERDRPRRRPCWRMGQESGEPGTPFTVIASDRPEVEAEETRGPQAEP